MDTTADSLRRMIYALLITLAVGMVGGRIMAVARVYEPYLFRPEGDTTDNRSLWPRTRPEPMPTHGDNDRSRWDTVRALVDDSTYVIGRRETDPTTGKYVDSGIITEDGWKTIDKVLRPDTQEFYSSKPPLLPTLVAGEYWLLKKIFGWSIVEQRWTVVPVILLTVNWLPLIIYLALLARLAETLGTMEWSRVFVLAAGGFGTFLTPFSITLNNHTVATCSALFALYPSLRIWNGAERNGWLYLLAGFFAGFTACNELPAALFAALLFLILLRRSVPLTLFVFVPAAAIPVAAFLLTNYEAIGQLRPAYDELGGPWYEYEGSHWKQPGPGETKHGIDWARFKETKADYAFHLLVGHHGLFSLSPIYLLALVGTIAGLAHKPTEIDSKTPSALKPLSALTFVLTLVIVGFYIIKSDNYGGWTSGLRWLMWLTPLWLLTMLPALDWLALRRWGRGLAYVFLAISVFSASYPAWNPWRHPWLYNWLESQGWISY